MRVIWYLLYGSWTASLLISLLASLDVVHWGWAMLTWCLWIALIEGALWVLCHYRENK